MYPVPEKFLKKIVSPAKTQNYKARTHAIVNFATVATF